MRYIPVLPSSLLGLDDGEFNAHKKNLNDFSLKSGVIISTYEIDDKQNISKSHVEYDVLSVEQNGDMGTSSIVYKRCPVMEGFGGIADFFEAKRRKPKSKVKTDKEPQNSNGSIVLLLCLSGNRDKGVIIGALKHPKRKTNLKKDESHLEGEFNGVNWKIDKDGALTVTFRSATDNDGKQADEKAAGSNLKMEKDGSIEISDGNKEKIRIDKTKKTVDINAEADISATSDASVNVTAKKNFNAKATADLLADAGGSFTANSGGAFNIKATGALEVKAASVKVESEGDVKVKGTAVTIAAPSINLGDGGSPALVLSTQFMGIGNLGAPVMCTAIGPFSSVVFIAS
jgi:phage gp45-like